MKPRVRVHDDLLHYLDDTLKWIDSYNPGRQQPQSGLNLHGVTVITAPESAAEIVEAWASLSSRSPKKLKLTGAYGWTARRPDSGRHEHLRFDRDVVVRKVSRLAALCRQAAASRGEKYVLHLGI
jgi:hypothetical protein